PNGHDHSNISVDHIGGIPRTAHTDFDDRNINWGIGKGSVRNTNKHFKLAHRWATFGFRGLVNHLYIRLDFFPNTHVIARVNGLAINTDAFGYPLQMRRGHQTYAAVKSAQQRINHARSRGLTVGSSHLNDIKRALWIAQKVHEHFDAVK